MSFYLFQESLAQVMYDQLGFNEPPARFLQVEAYLVFRAVGGNVISIHSGELSI